MIPLRSNSSLNFIYNFFIFAPRALKSTYDTSLILWCYNFIYRFCIYEHYLYVIGLSKYAASHLALIFRHHVFPTDFRLDLKSSEINSGPTVFLQAALQENSIAEGIKHWLLCHRLSLLKTVVLRYVKYDIKISNHIVNDGLKLTRSRLNKKKFYLC